MRKLFFVGLASLATLGLLGCGDDDDSSSGGACAIKVSGTTVLCVEADAMTEAICDSSASDYEGDSITVESMSSCPSNETKTCEESSMTYYVYADSSYDYCALFEAIE